MYIVWVGFLRHAYSTRAFEHIIFFFPVATHGHFFSEELNIGAIFR